jgi:hypothetical protein
MAEINPHEQDDNRIIFVDFETSQDHDDTVVIGAVIKLCSLNLHRHWAWRVNIVESLVFIRMLLSVVSLIPEALFTAICINKRNEPNIDGRLIIDMISELLEMLNNLAFIVPPPPLPTQIHVIPLTPQAANGAEFPEDGSHSPVTMQLQLMISDLVEIKEHLEDRTLNDEFMTQTYMFLGVCGNVRTMCEIYLYFVYLVWQRTNLNGDFNHAEVEIARRRTYSSIQDDSHCLLTEFINMYEAQFGPIV